MAHISDRQTQFSQRPIWKGRKILDFGGNVAGFLVDAGNRVAHDDFWCLDVTRAAIEQGWSLSDRDERPLLQAEQGRIQRSLIQVERAARDLLDPLCQPEPVLREILHYIKFLESQRQGEAPMDGVVADTWEKLGPAPDVDYDKL